jgi:hypothetical protein
MVKRGTGKGKFILIAVILVLAVVGGVLWKSTRPIGEKIEVGDLQFEKRNIKDGYFSISMPSEPEREVVKVPGGIGDAELIIYTSEASQDLAYGATFNHFPYDFIINSVPKSIVENSANGAVEGVNGELIDEKDLKIEDYPGKEIKFSAPGGFVRTRIYLIGNTLYQLTVSSSTENEVDNENAIMFLDSFEPNTKNILFESDISGCFELPLESEQNFIDYLICFTDLSHIAAVLFSSTSECESFDTNLGPKMCQTGVAIFSKNEVICEAIKGDILTGYQFRDFCINLVAFNTDNKDLCDKLPKGQIEPCKLDIDNK